MQTDKKTYLKAILWIIIAGIMGMRLPHMGRSLAQFIIPPIESSKNSVILLNGILVMLPLYIASLKIHKIYNLKSKIIIFIVLLMLSPTIINIVDTIVIPYYYFSEGVKSIDVVDSSYGFSFSNGIKKTAKLKIKVINYSGDYKEFKMALIVPKELSDIGIPERLEFPEKYAIRPRGSIEIEGFYDLSDNKTLTHNKLSDADYHFKEYEVQLYSDKEYVNIKQWR